MSVDGDLYDPEPDRDRVASQSKSRFQALHREWVFWVSMMVGLWAAFQGQALTAILFLGIAVTAPSVAFLWTQARDQIRESKEKGFWS